MGGGGDGGGTLNFVDYKDWVQASSVYQKKKKKKKKKKKNTVFSHTKKKKKKKKKSGISAIPQKISADINIPKKIFPLLCFCKRVIFIYFSV